MQRSTYHTIELNYSHLILTRGPRGPWLAHLRKRSKVTVEPFPEDLLCCPPNIGRGPLDDVIQYYIKDESSWPFTFRQEDF